MVGVCVCVCARARSFHFIFPRLSMCCCCALNLQEVSVFVFEKKLIERYSKRDREVLLEILQKRCIAVDAATTSKDPVGSSSTRRFQVNKTRNLELLLQAHVQADWVQCLLWFGLWIS